MNKTKIMTVLFVFGVIACICMPESAFAQWAGGGGFETKMHGLTDKLITVILPLISVLGLLYAVILALTGDGAAKGRIIMVIIYSVVGFLAPHIIGWIQSASGQ